MEHGVEVRPLFGDVVRPHLREQEGDRAVVKTQGGDNVVMTGKGKYANAVVRGLFDQFYCLVFRKFEPVGIEVFGLHRVRDVNGDKNIRTSGLDGNLALFDHRLRQRNNHKDKREKKKRIARVSAKTPAVQSELLQHILVKIRKALCVPRHYQIKEQEHHRKHQIDKYRVEKTHAHPFLDRISRYASRLIRLAKRK